MITDRAIYAPHEYHVLNRNKMYDSHNQSLYSDGVLNELSSVDLADCPGSYGDDNCEHDNWVKPIFGFTPVVFSLISCSASVIGSILTIMPYLLWKDIRTGIRAIITFLALADLITASAYIMASINYITYYKEINTADEDTKVRACTKFDNVCQIQAYISSWSSLSSFWWTCILALYIYWTVEKSDLTKINKLFPLYHVLAWGSPVLVMLPLLLTGSLGYSLFAAGGWCFIRGHRNVGYSSYQDFSLTFTTVVKIFAGGKAFEISTYIWVIVLYTMIHCSIRKKKKRESGLEMNKLLKQVEKKLYWIPVAFIILRMWGTLQFIFSIFVFTTKAVNSTTGCVPKGIYYVYKVLAVIQSVGDGGQGWCNAILYIFWSPKIRERLILTPLYLCCLKLSQILIPVTYFSRSKLSSTPAQVHAHGHRQQQARGEDGQQEHLKTSDTIPLSNSIEDLSKNVESDDRPQRNTVN